MKLLSKSMMKLTKYNKALLLMLLLIGSISSYGQYNISVPFSNGFVGLNTANNKANNAYSLSSIGITNVKFSQNSTATNFTLQGNDITGNVILTDFAGVEYSIPGFVKWRAPSGTVTTMVFEPLPATNITIATNGANGSSSYNIKGSTYTGSAYIGLTFNGKTLTIAASPNNDVSGNAATSGLLTELNTYLGTFISLTINDFIVNESAGTVTLTVTLSAALSGTASFSYTTTDATATASSDYTASPAFGTINLVNGQRSATIDIQIIDDSVVETTESFKVVLSNPLNVSITDGTGLASIIDNDSSTPAIILAGYLSPFSSCQGSVSVEQSFQVAGSNLTNNLDVAAPTGYEVSLTSGSGFASSVSIAPSAGSVANTPIYVRLAATALNGASGDIALTSTGATTVNVATGIAVVSPPSVAGTISGATTVCSGTNSTTLTLSGNTGDVVKWQSSTTSDFSGTITDISTTSTTYTATNLTATTYFRAVVQSGVCASANSAAATITVDPTTVAGTITGATTVCSGTNSTVLTLGGKTGDVVKWQSSATSDFSGTITDISTTSTTYTATNLTATTYFRAVVQSGVCTSANSAAATITVNPTTVAGTITGAATVCSGTNSTVLTLGANTGTVVKWQSSATSDFSGTITDISTTSTTYTATNLTATTYYRAIVQSGVCASATTAAVAVTVNPLPTSVIYGVNSICNGNTIALSAANSSPDINYTAVLGSEVITEAISGWQSFTSGVSGNLSKVVFGFKNTSNTTSFVAKLNVYSGEGNTGTLLTSQYVTINQPASGLVIQDFILNSPVALTASSIYTAELVAVSPINKISFLNSDSASNPSGGTSNVNSSTDYYFTNEVIPSPSNLSFQWQVDTGSGYANVATNGTNQFITPGIAGNYKVTITNTTTGCSNTSAAKTVTVNPKPIADAGADVKVCGTTTATYTLSGSSASNNSSIFWYSGGTGTFGDVSLLHPTYTPSEADKLAGAVNLTMIVGGSLACASEVGYDQMTLSFGLAPTSSAGVDASICSNATFKTVAYATNGNVLWSTPSNGTFDDATLMNPVYTPGSQDISAGSVTLTMTVTGTESSCTTTTSVDTVVLTVSPAPTASAGPSDVNVCTGLTYFASAAAATNGTVLWTTSGSGTFDNSTLVKSTYTPSSTDLTNGSVVLTMTVTGTSCNAVSTIRLLFTPVPVANAGVDAAVCSNEIFSISGIASGGTIKWTTSGNGTFNDDTALNTDYTPASTDTNVTLTLTVTGTNECASLAPVVDTMILSVSPAPTASAGPSVSGPKTATICSNTTYQTQGQATNGTILWATSGSGTFSNTAIASPIYTPSSADKLAGNVTLTITVTGLSGGSCEGKVLFDTISLAIAPLPTANAGPASDHICSGSTYTLGGTATNGAILWTTSGTGTFTGGTTATPVYTPSSADITAGTVRLTMTVTGNAACTAPTDFVDLRIFTVALATSQLNVTCNGLSNGTASVTPSGGTAPYTYVWRRSGSPTIISTLYSAINLAAGDYSCVVTDANLCTATSNFTITQPALLTATTNQNNVSTNGGADGLATVSVSGGTSPYSYVWSPSGGTDATARDLLAGTYTCTIIDANSCSIVKSFIITEPSNFTATATQANILCNGLTTGSATITVSGGVSPITYSWSPSGGSGATASNLAAGTYTCTIRDNNGNGLTLTKTVTITQPSALTATTSQTNVLIYGNATGAVSVNVSGGNSPYTYSWTNSSSVSATVTNLTAGTYVCTIRDANGCSTTKTTTITQPAILASTGSSSTNVICNGGATGSATMAITGGVTPYTYLWSPSVSTGSTASNLVAGTYTCTVTDANGALQTKSFVISQPSALTATTSQTNVSCNGSSTGTASVVVSGGVFPYSYLWTNSSSTSATATGLSSGPYVCTITDANGCTLTKSFTITQPSALSATVSQTDVAIFGDTTGSASVNVSGGTPGYAYLWSPSGGTGATAINLSAGSYTCTITDAKGCTLTQTFAINQPGTLTATTSQTNVLCHGTSTGTASVVVSGGSSSYDYLWSPFGGTSASASNLVAGSYTCSIRDTNGALLVKSFIITHPPLLTATTTQTNVVVNGGSTGVATVTVSGGSTGYSYSWTNSSSTSATASNLTAGTYTCTITDANSCSITKTFVITQPTALAASPSQTNVLCNSGSTGAASVSVTGGVLPYTYSWSPSVGTGASVTGLASGTYTCTITDANGASILESFTITQPTALTATQSQTNVSCSAGSNGTATVTATGGTAGYSYSWTNSSSTSATASNLTAGTYACTVTDANGCSIVKSFTVTQPSALTATPTQTNVAINGNSTGVATVIVSGGTTGYTYLWTNSSSTSATASNLAAGTYTCTITDANGCSIDKTFVITQPTALVATTSQTNVLCNGASTGVASVTASGAVGPYTYLWTNSSSTSATASNLVAGTYTCTITDANNSVITKTIVITQAAVIPLPIANAGPDTDSICSGLTYATSGTASNGTVLWTTNGSGIFNNASLANTVYTPSAADRATGSVVLTMTVIANGSCNIPSVSDSLTLTIYPTSNAGIIAGATTVCKGTNSTVLTLSEYTGTIQWQNSTDNVNFNTIPSANSATYTASNLVATTYYRAVVTSGVCSSATSATSTIVVSPTSVAGTLSGAAPVCYGTNSTVLTLSGNLGTIKWQSSTDNSTFVTIPGATGSTYTASNLTATTYYRAVSTSGVCSSAIANATIVVNLLPIANAGPSTASICAGTSYTTAGVATNGTSSWTTSGTGTFANANNAITTYTPSSLDQTNGSVVLRMTVTGSTSGCTLNTDSDTIIVSINSPSAPVAAANQNLCYLVNPTIANLATTSGTNVNWYAASLGGVALNATTALVSGNTYYATQNVTGCESITRTPVLVTLTCNINPVADTFNSINGYTGGTTPSVLNNDLLDGALLVPSKVILSGVTIPTGFVLNANGTITIPSGTKAGSYSLTYKICEVLNPTNCNQAIVTIVVNPPVINAVADNYGPLNGFQGVTTLSVLANDLLNGTIVSQNEINWTVVTLPSPLVMNPDGTITVPPGTAPGIYVINYKITEKLNPTNFSQITAVVTVGDCLIFPTNDCDGDGVTNAQEILDGTNPSDFCSMNFAHQTLAVSLVWRNSDCDGDGVANGQEILDGTNPTDLCSFVLAHKTLSASADWNNSDCDGDGVRNGQEIIDGTDPSLSCSLNSIHISTATSTAWKNADCDGDGVTNGQEILDGTNPVDTCSFNPAHQTLALSTAWKNADCDGDGVTNGQEILYGTNPGDLCSFNVAHITLTTSTAWNNSDCDGDGVTNGREITDRTNPNDSCSFVTANQTLDPSAVWDNQDCDGDGVTNGSEIVDKTNPLDSCSLVTAHQSLTPSSAWKNADCDGDGVTNGQEVIDGTDVNNACSSNPAHVTLGLSQAFLAGDCDGDGLTNGEEIGQYPTKPNDFDNNGIPDYLELNNHSVSDDDLEIFNVVTPNGNGDNDVFVIRNIELYPNNTVTIFNRWGVIVYEVDSYGKDNKLFKGISEGRSTMRKLEELPVETYFYTIRYVNSKGVEKLRSGYLYLNK